MDRLESLGNQLSQITMYDIKSMYEQAKNVVLNVSEIEAKVREATNDDPWGASSTLMQEIANRTFNYPDFNEIMPSIYSKFMEKEARQWRQIYKSLQLLEYLIKHGSERVVDDARAHISTIKMLRSFHYIDDKGKDQGINIRNRAKEIVELLSDVDKIRAERRKAKTNKNKYTGQGSDGMSFSSGGSRYGGFGSDYGGSNYGNYGGGSSSSSYGNDRYGSGGGSSSSFRDESGRRGYEEYNAGDDEDVPVSSARRSNSLNTNPRATPTKRENAPAPVPAPVREVDLLGGFDDDTFGNPVTAPPPKTNATSFATDKALPAVGAPKQPAVSIDDDDFADFQAAPSSLTAPAPASAPVAPKMNLMDMLNSGQSTTATSPPPLQNQQFNMGSSNAGMGGMGTMGGGGMGMGGNMGMGMGMGMSAGMGMHRSNTSMSGSSQFSSPMQPTSPTGISPMRPSMTPATSTTSAKSPTTGGASSKPASGASANFDDLWSMSLGSSKPPSGPTTGKSMKDLEKEKSMAGLWGGAGAGAAKPPMGSMDTFGAFGGSSTGAGNTSSSGGGDDLLL
ncbi:ENTH-domain-containing protein [Marasmius fiardii PR-910]|nr:ENTH-domain-containing protein [Marasmius fiardii PR-910]